MGWAEFADQEVLGRAATRFDAVVTFDRGMGAPSPVPPRVAVILLRAASNRIEDLHPLVPQILQALDTSRRGAVTVVGA